MAKASNRNFFVKFVKDKEGGYMWAFKSNATGGKPFPNMTLSRKRDRKRMIPVHSFFPLHGEGWLVKIVQERERSYLCSPVAGPFVTEDWSQSAPNGPTEMIVARSCYSTGRAATGSASECGVLFMNSARSLGMIPGVACVEGHRGFMETWTNDKGYKRAWGYDACKEEVY